VSDASAHTSVPRPPPPNPSVVLKRSAHLPTPEWVSLVLLLLLLVAHAAGGSGELLHVILQRRGGGAPGDAEAGKGLLYVCTGDACVGILPLEFSCSCSCSCCAGGGVAGVCGGGGGGGRLYSSERNSSMSIRQRGSR
jgi:hypothetical protein